MKHTGSAVGRVEIHDGAFCLHDERADVRLWLVSPERSVVACLPGVVGERVLLTFHVTPAIEERVVIPLQIQRCPEEYRKPRFFAQFFTHGGKCGLYRSNDFSQPNVLGSFRSHNGRACDLVPLFIDATDFALLHGKAIASGDDEVPSYSQAVITGEIEICGLSHQARKIIAVQSKDEWLEAQRPPEPSALALPAINEADGSRDVNLPRRRRPISTHLRYEVFRRDGHRCVDCGASAHDDPFVRLEVDHRIPVSKGGSNSLDNLQTLCWACNNGKADRIDHKLGAPHGKAERCAQSSATDTDRTSASTTNPFVVATEIEPTDVSIRELEARWGISRNGLKSRAARLGVELRRVSSTLTVWPGEYVELGERLHEHISSGQPMGTFWGVRSVA